MNAIRGRPVDPDKADKQKMQLLEAALKLLRIKSYKTISIRELSSEAGVTSAMVSYYFGNKEGLFLAVVEKMASEHLSHMNDIVHSEDPIKRFIQNMIGMLCQNAGVAKFIHDEILSTESELRDAFIEKFPSRMAKFLPSLIKSYQINGVFRKNLNPKYVAFSLITMIIMPFIAEPVRDKAWGITSEHLAEPEWADHIYQLFLNGCKAR